MKQSKVTLRQLIQFVNWASYKKKNPQDPQPEGFLHQKATTQAKETYMDSALGKMIFEVMPEIEVAISPIRNLELEYYRSIDKAKRSYSYKVIIHEQSNMPDYFATTYEQSGAKSAELLDVIDKLSADHQTNVNALLNSMVTINVNYPKDIEVQLRYYNMHNNPNILLLFSGILIEPKETKLTGLTNGES